MLDKKQPVDIERDDRVMTMVQNVRSEFSRTYFDREGCFGGAQSMPALVLVSAVCCTQANSFSFYSWYLISSYQSD